MKQETLKKALSTEVKYILGVATFAIGVVAPFYSVKQDVALIKQNHYTHIENMQREIEDLKEEQVRLEDRQVDLMTVIAERLPR